jgi:Icc protein
MAAGVVLDLLGAPRRASRGRLSALSCGTLAQLLAAVLRSHHVQAEPAPVALVGESMTKRFAIATDVHLNFVDRYQLIKFIDSIRATTPNGLFLTGDISEGPALAQHLEILYLGVQKPIYFVCGNHDFYQSSTDAVRESLARLHARYPNIHYLRNTVHRLTRACALVGVDGWADARIGLPERGRIELADWSLIKDYKDVQAQWSVHERMQLAAAYADRVAALLDQQLIEAVKTYAKIIVLTHVPPFKGATWHEGKISGDDWLPWFSCKAVGDILALHADQNPGIVFEVYCGHTHGGGVYEHFSNLIVHTNPAKYGAPKVASTIDV